MQNAALAENEITPVLPSLGYTLASQAVSAQMRRLFGPRGYASRRDVLLAANMDTASEAEHCEPWAAYRKAKRPKKDGGGHGSREKGKSSGAGRAKNAINRRTGERNRCYTCNSEYHYAPQRPQEENRYGGALFSQRRSKKPPNTPYSSIAIETPVGVGSPLKLAPVGPARSHENSFSAPIESGGGGLWPPNRRVWSRWIPERRRNRFVTNGWEIVIRFWGNRDLRSRFPIPLQRGASLGMGGWAKWNTQRISRCALRVARAPSRPLCWMLRFRLYCAKAHWKHWAPNLISKRIFCLL